jgi:hypothetical protein
MVFQPDMADHTERGVAIAPLWTRLIQSPTESNARGISRLLQ